MSRQEERGGEKRRLSDAGRRLRSVVLVSCALALLGSSSASALSQRGHTFSFSFGAPGKAEGQFLSPAAVALNAVNGHVYVADRLGNRVEEFEPKTGAEGELTEEKFVREFKVFSPEFIAVDDSASSPSKGDVYVAGTTEGKAKKAEKEHLVAEDATVFKFGPGGEALGEIKKFKPTEPRPEEAAESKFEDIQGLAVDPAGDLYIWDSEAVADVFNGAQPNVARFSVESSFGTGSPGLAIDSAQNLYVGHLSTNVDVIGPSGEPPVIGKIDSSGGTLIEELDQETSSSVAVDTGEGDAVYVANTHSAGGKPASTIAAFTPAGVPIQRFGAGMLEDATGVAVDPVSHNVFVADAAAGKVDVFKLEPSGPPQVGGLSACFASASNPSCAKEPGAVKLSALVDPSGDATSAYFEYGAAPCSSAPAACTRSPEASLGAGFGDQPISIELLGLAPGLYHYRVTATNGSGTVQSAEETFSIAGAAPALPDGRQWELVSPPNKDGAEAEAITREGGTIQAAARGGAISYVTDAPVPAGSEPEGNRNLEYTQVISVRGPGGWTSQDISTPHTYGAGVEPGRQEYRSFSANLALGLVQPFPGIAGATALAQPPLSPPEEFELEGKTVKERTQEKTIYLRADQQLTPETPSERANYEAAKHNGEIMHNAGFLALVTEADAPGGAKQCVERPVGTPCFGGGRGHGVDVVSGTPDLSHVLLVSEKAAPGLYEWGGEPRLQLVSVMPGGEPAEGTVQFAGLHNVRNAVSENGSLVFWAESTGTETHLYVRNTVSHQTTQVDEVAPGASGTGTGAATFQAASTDGSRVFFTDTQRLTKDSLAGEFTGVRKPDLYVFELGATVEQPNCSLTAGGRLCDLTAEGVNGESGYIVEQGEVPNTGGGVLAASNDGSSVYFVANSALTEGAVHGNCVTKIEVVAGRKCNLYVRRNDGVEWTAPRLVAVISNEDAPDWGGSHGGPGELRNLTSRVSPSGRYLAFMSRESLTGYDNEDVTSKAPGERMDEEVFLYDAATERTVCASCNPSGARPEGVFDPGQSNEGGAGEGIGLVIDRVGIWEAGEPMVDHWLAGNVPGWTSAALATAVYQSRYLSDNGRVFFNSPDHLVPAGTGAKSKVYQYEPAGAGTCSSEGGCVGLLSSGTSDHESAFIDASEGGSEAFFVTAAKLTSQDLDGNFDVYDAHVCEASSPCATPPPPAPSPCQETPELPCKGGATPAPSYSAPASAGISVAGNIIPKGAALPSKTSKPPAKPETRAQKLARALSACRHKYKKSKSKRRSCERAAHKKYASKAKKGRR
jgi:DNA-binding beta-propeller fold protein YncE